MLEKLHTFKIYVIVKQMNWNQTYTLRATENINLQKYVWHASNNWYCVTQNVNGEIIHFQLINKYTGTFCYKESRLQHNNQFSKHLFTHNTILMYLRTKKLTITSISIIKHATEKQLIIRVLNRRLFIHWMFNWTSCDKLVPLAEGNFTWMKMYHS